MPFIQRCLEPINVSRVEVDEGIKDELECVTNHTLSNIILQLSSLSKHAEDMFTELSQEVQTFTDRTRQLERRIRNLKETVTTLYVSEEVSINDATKRKPYKSSTRLDQQVVSKCTAPRCVLKAYSQCDAKPALDKLNQYRVDGRDCLKFYTNPDFFIELWLKEIQRDIRNKERLLRKLPLHQRIGTKKDGYGKRTPRSLQSIVQKYENRKHGVEFSSNNAGSIKANAYKNQSARSLDVHERKPVNKSSEQRNQQPHLNKPQFSHDIPKQSKIHKEKNNAGIPETQHPLIIQSNMSNLQRQLSKTVSLRAAARPIEPPPPPPPTYKLLRDTTEVNPSSPINQYPSPCTHLPFLNPEQNFPPPPSPPPPYMDQEEALPPPSSLFMVKEVAPPPPPPPYVEPKMAPPPPPPPLPPTMGKTNEVDDEKSNWVTSLKGLLSASRKLKPTPKRQPKDDNRSKLLQEIKEFGRGKLRPVDRPWEEKVEEKPIPAANIDVHALMEKMLSISEMIQPSDEDDEENSSEDDDDWN
ncbi:actin-binding protein WASF2-like [Saccostrea cucullata]|uniref:actin-binding protein WASF2-like n=1 Tax=Saccostrea cuccullata TaxID=36930 RepID=UPI002ED0A719